MVAGRLTSSTGPHRWLGAGLAAGLALTGTMLTLRLWLAAPSFPEQIQDALLLRIPAPIFGWTLAWLGFSAKPVLFVGIVVALAVAAAGVGMLAGLARDRVAPRLGQLGLPLAALLGGALWFAVVAGLVPLLGGLSFWSSAHGSGSSWPRALPMATLPGLAWGLTLALLGRAAGERMGASVGGTLSRRTLAGGLLGLAGTLATIVGTRRLTQGAHQTGRPSVRVALNVPTPISLPTPAPSPSPPSPPTASPTLRPTAPPSATPRRVPSPSPTPATGALTLTPTPAPSPTSTATPTASPQASATPTAAPAPELAQTMIPDSVVPLLTPNADFYVISKNFIDPSVAADSWQLEIGGLVARPLSLSYTDLLALPAQSEVVALECISNPVGGELLSSTVWTGVPLKLLLEQAGVDPSATTVVFGAADTYTESHPLEAALRQTTLVVYLMNGEPLPFQHGFPARLLVPGHYGMKNPKWLRTIALQAGGYVGYWGQRGWNPDTPIKTTARIDTPASGSQALTGRCRWAALPWLAIAASRVWSCK